MLLPSPDDFRGGLLTPRADAGPKRKRGRTKTLGYASRSCRRHSPVRDAEQVIATANEEAAVGDRRGGVDLLADRVLHRSLELGRGVEDVHRTILTGLVNLAVDQDRRRRHRAAQPFAP